MTEAEKLYNYLIKIDKKPGKGSINDFLKDNSQVDILLFHPINKEAICIFKDNSSLLFNDHEMGLHENIYIGRVTCSAIRGGFEAGTLQQDYPLHYGKKND